MHLWRLYTNIHATYEVAPITAVARIAVHRCTNDDDNDSDFNNDATA